MINLDKEAAAFERRKRGRIATIDGEAAQNITMRLMREMGLMCVERIETGFKVISKGGKIIGARPAKKVSGDIRAIASNGQAVHVECKFRPNDRLIWTDFEEHQPGHLQAVTDAGGLAFVSWVTSIHPPRLFWLKWPIPGFRKGKALTEIEAAKLPSEFFNMPKRNER